MTHQLSPQQTQLVKQDQLHEAKVGLKGHSALWLQDLYNVGGAHPTLSKGLLQANAQIPPLSAMLVSCNAAVTLELLTASVRPLGN